MRAKGIEPMRDEQPKQATGRRSIKRGHVVGLLVLAVALGAAAWLMMPRAAVDEGDGRASGILTLAALEERLATEKLDAGGLERLLIADDAIVRFAEQSAGSKDDPVAIADAVYEAIRARASASAFVPWSLGELRSAPVMTAAETFAKLQKDGARVELYPLEVAAVAVAALRARDVPAQVAELVDVPGESTPLDPSGYLGYFVVAVHAEGEEAGPRLYDVYGGRTLADAQHAVLSDTNALGAALSLRALHENTYLADPKRALASSSSALRLAARLPSVRTVRGVVVLTEKMVEQGLQEFQAARELRGDAPRLHNLASVMLMTGGADKARTVLSGVLEKAPDFAGARATLAALLMMEGQSDQAYAELVRAERLAPKLSLVQWGLTDYQMRQGDRDAALERARRVFAARPSFDAKLRLAAVLRQAAKYDEMRALAAEMLAQAPQYRRAELRELLTSLLGNTALEPDLPTRLDTEADDLSDLPGPDLDLQAPSPTDTGLGQKAPKLRLGEPGQGLRLKLGGE